MLAAVDDRFGRHIDFNIDFVVAMVDVDVVDCASWSFDMVMLAPFSDVLFWECDVDIVVDCVCVPGRRALGWTR